MSLNHIPLDQIEERDLVRLIDAKAAEARNIEYKRQSYGDSDGDRAEWLADVSSFANTAGGDLILGMDAKEGVPIAIAPLLINLDQEVLRLEQIAQSSLQPRIAHLDFKRVHVASGEVLIVRIPRSYNPPHRVVRNGRGQNRFWARSSAGKYEPNVDELRALFNLAPQLIDRIRDFRAERIARIAASLAPVKLMSGPFFVMHVVPFSSLDPGGEPLSLTAVEQKPHAFAPMGSRSANDCRINFDGALMPSNANRLAAEQRAYMQLYRTGRLEAVASSIARGDGTGGVPLRLSSIDIEGLVLSALVRSLKGLVELGVAPPFAILVSLLGAAGLQMNVGARSAWPDDDDDIGLLTESQYHFAEVIVESVPQSIQDAGRMLRPFIEQLANTAGKASSSSFGPQGEYLHAFQ